MSRPAKDRPAVRVDERGGGTAFLFVFIFSFLIVGAMVTMFKIAGGDRRMTQAKKYQTIALQAADSALEQTLSRIRNGEIKLAQEIPPTGTPTPTPVVIQVPVGVDAYSTTATVRIDFARRPDGSLIRDFESNLQYDASCAVTSVLAVGTQNKGTVRRGVRARFTIVNFGRYMSFAFNDDGKSLNNGAFNGPYHVNGSVTMKGNCDWNAKYRKFTAPAGALNPFYDPTYTTVVYGNIIDGGGTYPMNMWSTRGTTIAKCTASAPAASFDIMAVPSRPEGTWIDRAHGAYRIAMPEIPFSDYDSIAQLILTTAQIRDIGRYVVQGAGLSGVGLQNHPGGPRAGQIDVGIATTALSQDNWPIRINLNALNRGRSSAPVSVGAFGQCLTGEGYLGENDLEAQQNYEKALASEYGLIIFVDGNAAVWGRLPAASGVTNINKKVTIISTGHVFIVGDVLPSASPYGAGVDGEAVSATPTINNPTNDAIAILADKNIYVNPWYRNQPAFFYNSCCGPTSCTAGGDMRISAFLYAPKGVTGGSNGTTGTSGPARGRIPYRSETGRCTDIQNFTFHGAVSVDTSGYLPSSGGYYRMYDPMLKYNLSKAIPSATVLLSWQEMLDIKDSLFVVPLTPTPTP